MIHNLERLKQKWELWNRFRLKVFEINAKKKLLKLFDNRCAKCKILIHEVQLNYYVRNPFPKLAIDHHVPFEKGGKLQSGNLVVLCRKCNGNKGLKFPETFYTTDEIDKIESILEKQHNIFDFQFEWKKFTEDRNGYMREFGISEEDIKHTNFNTDHPFYIPPTKSNEPGITFTAISKEELEVITKNFSEKEIENESIWDFSSHKKLKKGNSVALTGTFKIPREKLEAELKLHGLEIRRVLNDSVEFVITGENSGSKKEKAISLKIPLINEDQIIEWLTSQR